MRQRRRTAFFLLLTSACAPWWASAAELRSGGYDRILIPHPQNRTIEQLCAAKVSAITYAHELIRVERGQPTKFLDTVVTAAPNAAGRFGWELIGAWRTAMAADDECILLWAIPSWQAWGVAERALGDKPELLIGEAEADLLSRHRVLLVDAPLSPLRTGRQPARSDRTDWQD